MSETAPAKPTGKRHVVAQIVLTREGAVKLVNAFMQLAGALKKAGILKDPHAAWIERGRARGAPSPRRPTTGAHQRQAGVASYDSLEQQMASLLRRPDRNFEIHRRSTRRCSNCELGLIPASPGNTINTAIVRTRYFCGWPRRCQADRMTATKSVLAGLE